MSVIPNGWLANPIADTAFTLQSESPRILFFLTRYKLQIFYCAKHPKPDHSFIHSFISHSLIRVETLLGFFQKKKISVKYPPLTKVN